MSRKIRVVIVILVKERREEMELTPAPKTPPLPTLNPRAKRGKKISSAARLKSLILRLI